MLDTVRRWKLFLLNRPLWARRREFERLRRQPRYTPGVSNLAGLNLEYADAASFDFIFREVFDRQIYRFRSAKSAPVILDCGANIGLSVLYFKRLYPEAKIVAFEPDPKVFEVLRRNVAIAGLQDVRLEQSAVWNCDGELTFMSEGADAGRVTAIDEATTRCNVKAVRLLDWLDREVDFLKLDIEGAEYSVIQDCAERLANVKTLFVEYHSFVGQPQVLPELLSLIRQAGFRFFCDERCNVSQPFWEIRPHLGMDFQLNIYAYRP